MVDYRFSLPALQHIRRPPLHRLTSQSHLSQCACSDCKYCKLYTDHRTTAPQLSSIYVARFKEKNQIQNKIIPSTSAWMTLRRELKHASVCPRTSVTSIQESQKNLPRWYIHLLGGELSRSQLFSRICQDAARHQKKCSLSTSQIIPTPEKRKQTTNKQMLGQYLNHSC